MKTPWNRTMLVSIVLLAAMASASSAARAGGVYTVDTLLDQPDEDVSDGLCRTSANTCSLRAAVMQANNLLMPMRIDLRAGTYVLTRPPSGANDDNNGDLNLPAPLNAEQTVAINGAGATNTIIDANQTDGAFAIGAAREVIIRGVTIRNGRRQGASAMGGGIRNQGGRLTIDSCLVENNQATAGGAIYSSGAASRLDVLRSTIRSNDAVNGGGIEVDGLAVIRDSTINGNGADLGGGILVGIGSLYVENSTISGNFANEYGGGVYNFDQTFLFNTSVVNNDADHDRDEDGGVGGGIFAYPNSGARFAVFNSLIANNTIFDAPIYDDCKGIIEAGGLNFFGDITGCDTGWWALVSIGTIGPLQDNGGPTWTHELLAGSEAIDGGDGCIDQLGDFLTTDQRGAPRIAGVRCDAGSFEHGATVPVEDRLFDNGFD